MEISKKFVCGCGGGGGGVSWCGRKIRTFTLRVFFVDSLCYGGSGRVWLIQLQNAKCKGKALKEKNKGCFLVLFHLFVFFVSHLSSF